LLVSEATSKDPTGRFTHAALLAGSAARDLIPAA
jgi:hypothetical protein